jgi:hypothetical protein
MSQALGSERACSRSLVRPGLHWVRGELGCESQGLRLRHFLSSLMVFLFALFGVSFWAWDFHNDLLDYTGNWAASSNKAILVRI